MAWGQFCQPNPHPLPPPPHSPGPLLSLLLQLELHTLSVQCHIAHTSILVSPGLKVQLSPFLFKPQPVHGALGGFRWSEVFFLLTQHSVQSSSGTPHFLMQFCPWTDYWLLLS